MDTFILYGANDGGTLIFGSEHEPPNAKHKGWEEIYRHEDRLMLETMATGYKRGQQRGYNFTKDIDAGINLYDN